MAGRVNIVVGRRCQLIAARALRRALTGVAEVQVIYAGDTPTIDLAAPYFQGISFARPDAYLAIASHEERVQATVKALLGLQPVAETGSGWLLWGVGPEVTAALLVARLKNEPVEWWDEGLEQPGPHGGVIQSLCGTLAESARHTPKPWRAAARSLMAETLPLAEGSAVLLALTDNPLWRLYAEEVERLITHLLEAGREVALYSPGNPTLLQALPQGLRLVGGPGLSGLLEEVTSASLVLGDRLDIGVAADALGRNRWHVGVRRTGLVHGPEGLPMGDLMEFGGHLVTLLPPAADAFDPLEEVAARWASGLQSFLSRLPC